MTSTMEDSFVGSQTLIDDRMSCVTNPFLPDVPPTAPVQRPPGGVPEDPSPSLPGAQAAGLRVELAEPEQVELSNVPHFIRDFVRWLGTRVGRYPIVSCYL